ncbi:MAG: DUF3795 domain-containing protein [Sphaerochaeta sp.]|nr:DUF3795 domain-containing protein [Sphaerochaeta sp.]
MDKQKGIAFCALACCLCDEKSSCRGCRQDDCPDKEGCKPYRCAQSEGYDGCWECPQFPCDFSLFSSLRIRTFVSFIAQYGKDALLEALQRGEDKGLCYHYPGQLIGDYDLPKSEDELVSLLLSR